MSDDMCVVAYELSNSDGETIIIRSERRQVESYKNRYSTDLVNELVRQSDALAKLAEKDTEILRLRGVLSEIAESDDTDNALDPERNKRVAREALKGGAE